MQTMLGGVLTKTFALMMATSAVDSLGKGKVHIHIYHDPRYLANGLQHLLNANLYNSNSIKNGNPLDIKRLQNLENNYPFPLTKSDPPFNSNRIPFNGPGGDRRRNKRFEQSNPVINKSRNGIDFRRVDPSGPFSIGNFLSQNGNGRGTQLNGFDRNNGISELQTLLNNLLSENDRLKRALNDIDSNDRKSVDKKPFDDFSARKEPLRNEDESKRPFRGIASIIPLNRNGDDNDENRGIPFRVSPFDDIPPRSTSPAMNGITAIDNNKPTPIRSRRDRNGAIRQPNRSQIGGVERPISAFEDIPQEELRRYRIDRYIQLNGNQSPIIQRDSTRLSGRPYGIYTNPSYNPYHNPYNNLPYGYFDGNPYNDYSRFPFALPRAGPFDEYYLRSNGIIYGTPRDMDREIRYSHYNGNYQRFNPRMPGRNYEPNSPFDLSSPFSATFGRRNGLYYDPYRYRNNFNGDNGHRQLHGVEGISRNFRRNKIHKKMKYRK